MERYTRQFYAIGTRWEIVCEYSEAQHNVEQLMHTIRNRIDQFDRCYSRFRDDSLITAISRTAGTYDLPADARHMLELYEQLYRLSDGRFTPLIGSTLAEAGYDAAYSFETKKMHAPAPWDAALSLNWPTLTTRMPVILDFGAAGKGYLVDIVARMLADTSPISYIIDAGGDIAAYSADMTPVRIGLEHPDDPSHVIGVASLRNGSIAGSSGNRRRWGSFHHIIDPHTLLSPSHIRATWVVSASAMLADALATCLYLVPQESLRSFYSFEYAVLYEDYSIAQSEAFPAELFFHGDALS